jgi:hypothetical protein
MFHLVWLGQVGIGNSTFHGLSQRDEILAGKAWLKIFAFLSKIAPGENIFDIFVILLVIQFYISELTGSPEQSHTGIRYYLQYSINVN